MKYGILVYNYPKEILEMNIGDYIQSLAAKQFIPNEEETVYVDRESLSDYDGENIRLILNGWFMFMHNPHKFPPSSKITPLFVSFHVNESVKDIILNDLNVEYLKKHAPIGCRDINTLNLLKAKGIDSYFSGCLTLTLNRSYSIANPVREEIIFTEFDPVFYKKKRLIKKIPYLLFHLLTKYRLIKKIAYCFHGVISIKTLIQASYFVSVYLKIFDIMTLKQATYIDHYVNISQFGSEEDRFNLAEQLLFKYANAKLVVTSKIHCALPSLGLNTPVIYIEDTEDSPSNLCRKTGLIELFDNVYDFHNGKLHKRLQQNKKTSGHTQFAEQMILLCNKFMLKK
jgi:hypothetical protein